MKNGGKSTIFPWGVKEWNFNKRRALYEMHSPDREWQQLVFSGEIETVQHDEWTFNDSKFYK